MSELKTTSECIEMICQQGCTAVRDIIIKIQEHETVVEIEHLDDQQKQSVLKELEIVMSVYDKSDC